MVGRAPPSRTVALFGDSHAAQWAAALEPIAARHGWALEVLSKASCPTAEVSIYLAAYQREYRECDVWRRDALALLAAKPPALTVVANSRAYSLPGIPLPAFRADLEAGLVQTLTELRRSGRVLMLADTPQPGSPPAICLSEHLDDPESCATPASVALDPSYTALERRAARRAGAGFADLNSSICPHRTCDPIHGNLMVYADGNHLTATFLRALEPQLARQVRLGQ
jgi:hypothetical protein